MKFVIIVNGLLAFSLSGITAIPYEQGSRLIPSLAPRVADHGISAKPSVTGYDNCEKNFTHDQLFALQKRFLDNFVAPKNAIQVRRTAPNRKITSTDQLSL